MNSATNCRELLLQLLETKKVSANKMLLDLGYSKSLIFDMGRNNSYPTADKLGKIAEYLDVSVDYLLGRTDKPEVNK
jgi:transcriptional regulator with XRE-family HTH domain